MDFAIPLSDGELRSAEGIFLQVFREDDLRRETSIYAEESDDSSPPPGRRLSAFSCFKSDDFQHPDNLSDVGDDHPATQFVKNQECVSDGWEDGDNGRCGPEYFPGREIFLKRFRENFVKKILGKISIIILGSVHEVL
jgi:hypothetical protein